MVMKRMRIRVCVVGIMRSRVWLCWDWFPMLSSPISLIPVFKGRINLYFMIKLYTHVSSRMQIKDIMTCHESDAQL